MLSGSAQGAGAGGASLGQAGPGEACAICCAGTYRKLFEAPDRLYRVPGQFTLLECQRCQAVRLATFDPSLNAYPDDAYYSFHAPSIAEVFAEHPSQWSQRAKRTLGNLSLRLLGYRGRAARPRAARAIERAAGKRAGYGYLGLPIARRGGWALDVGCGAGTALALLRQLGWNVTGVEASPVAAEVAHREYGVTILVGEVADLDLPRRRFEYIRMSHSLEHFQDPVTALRVLRGALHEDGEIYIETPNATAFNARAMGSYWIGWDPPRHHHVFSPMALSTALSASGFKVRSMNTIPHSKVFRYERAYRREEAVGTLDQSIRESVDLGVVARAAALRAGRLAQRRALSNDNLAVWATRD